MVDQAKAVTETKDQLITIKVNGEDKQMTKEEVVELAQKGSDYTNKTKALADDRKSLEAEKKRVEGLGTIVDEMETNPELKTALNKTYIDVKSGKISKEAGEARNQKMVDKWIDEADNNKDRTAYKELRTAIGEETKEIIKEAINTATKPLIEEISLLRDTSKIGLSNKIDTDLQKLEEELGKDLIEKHRTDIKVLAVKYPNQTVKKLLYQLADDTSLEEALIAKAEKLKKIELERKKRGSSVGGEDTITPKSKYEFDQAGRVTADSIAKRVKERLGIG